MFDVKNVNIEELFEYAVKIRRQLHEHPEVGFELPETTKLVSSELSAMGIENTGKYGVSSVVAEIGKGDKTVAIRADMDALPVEEKADVPFKSKIQGKMHACGHDSHTATLLAVAKYLKSVEDELPCRVRFIFQPAEECAVSGAKMMVENGVMDGVDSIICTHCEPALDAGLIGRCHGDYMAACVPLTIRFMGKTAHAAFAERGIDAIAMANEAYLKMKEAVAKEAAGDPYIWSVGRFSGGHVHNVVADLCEMDISFRFYNMDFAARAEAAVRKICEDTAARFGGKCEIVWEMSTGAIHNDETLMSTFESKIENTGVLTLAEVPRRMSSEDFAWYLEKAPGLIFRFGTRNEEKGCVALAHQNNFKIDEEGMRSAILAFIAYILD